MSKCIRYADFERVLTKLGLHRAKVDGPQIIFEDKEHDVLLVFPPYQPDEMVHAHHWMSARHTVDGMGILDRDNFDKLLDEYDTANLATK